MIFKLFQFVFLSSNRFQPCGNWSCSSQCPDLILCECNRLHHEDFMTIRVMDLGVNPTQGENNTVQLPPYKVYICQAGMETDFVELPPPSSNVHVLAYTHPCSWRIAMRVQSIPTPSIDGVISCPDLGHVLNKSPIYIEQSRHLK